MEKSNKQKIKEFLEIINENELYLRLSPKNNFKLILMKRADEFLMSKYNRSFLEEDLKKREDALKTTGDPLEKKFLECLIKMDKENIIWIDILEKIKPLELLQEKKYLIFKKNKKITSAKELFKIQNKIFLLKKELNKHVINKADAQEELKEISEKLIKKDKSLNQIFILGLLSDIFSISNNFGGTKASLSYTIIKKSIPQIRNTFLRTKKMKINAEKDLIKIKQLEKQFRESLK